MEPKQLFDTQLILFQSIGLFLEYSKDFSGFLMKIFGLFGYLSIVIAFVLHIHAAFIGSDNIEDLADALSSAGATLDSIVKMATFYLLNETYKTLLDSILKILERWLEFSNSKFVTAT